MINFFKWFAAFFEDQGGSSSSKRITLYVSLCYFGQLVYGSLNGKVINPDVLLAVSTIICICLGVVTTEMIAKFMSNKNTADKPQQQ